MRKGILTLCLSLVVIIGSAGVTSATCATSMYSATLPFFTHGLNPELFLPFTSGFTYGLDLETGEVHPRGMLIIVNGPIDDIDQVVGIENLDDFSYPDMVDFHFEYELVNELFLLVPDQAMQIAFVSDMTFDEVDYGVLTGLTFEDVGMGEALEFNPEDILVFKLSPPSTEDPLWRPFWVMDLTYYSGLETIEVDVKGIIPEPATLMLLGLGLVGLVGIVRRRKKGKRVHKQITMFILLLVLVGTASTALGETITITVTKDGIGKGTVMVGDVECGSDCEEKSITLPQNAAVILKALPTPESEFIGWTYADGTPITLENGVLNADGTNVSIVAYFGAESLVKTFAPILKFDSKATNQTPCNGFPMAAQTYYEEIIKTERYKNPHGAIQMCTYSEIKDTPTYYQAEVCGITGQVRIMYWWFYGLQRSCGWDDEGHYGDWERIMVTLNADRTQIKWVTYWQHKGWYTRKEGNFQLHEQTHPVVYVGKVAHGSYHDDGGGVLDTCCYWEDYRNPGSKLQVMRTWENDLVPLEKDPVTGQYAQEWMANDKGFSWGYKGCSTHPTWASNCDMNACEGESHIQICGTNGCFKSDISGLIPTSD